MEFLKKARFYIFLLILFSCVAFGCQSSNITQEVEHNFSAIQLEWQPLEQNADIATAEYSEKHLLIHCVKINLANPNLSIKIQSTQNKSVFAKKFTRKNNLAVAFNTTPFISGGNPFNKKQTPAGICIDNKKQISKPLAAYCALAFFSSGQGFTAKIFSAQNDENLQNADFAAGGFWQILKEGKIIQFEKIRDSRLFCAVDNEGKTLFVFAVEGENKNRSTGLTYMECAAFVKALGLENAMEFDGGASTQLAVEGNSLLSYKNKVKVPALIGFSYTN